MTTSYVHIRFDGMTAVVSADFAQAAAPIVIDGLATQYRVADARHTAHGAAKIAAYVVWPENFAAPSEWEAGDGSLSAAAWALVRVDPDGVRQQVMTKRHACSISTGICGATTFGSGDLCNYGYWSKPCRSCAQRYLAAHPEAKVWPAPLRVLYVEDEPAVAQATARALRASGVRVLHVERLSDFDSVLVREPASYDVVLTDWEFFPDDYSRTTHTTGRVVVATCERRGLPVVVLSGADRPEDCQSLFWLQKGIQIDDIIEALLQAFTRGA